MKQLIHKSFFKRNTDKGIARYLSTLGMDVARIHYEPGPDKYHVYAVETEEPIVLVEPVKPVKKVSKKRVFTKKKSKKK